jgi:hypothetical protein
MLSPIREAHETAANRRRTIALWFALSLLALTLLSVAVAHVTGGARVFSRFSPVFGLIGGAAMGWLALQIDRPMGRWRWAFPALLVGISFVGLTLEAYRMRVVELRAQFRTALPILHPELADSIRQKRKTVLAAKSRFGAYLSFRVSSDSLPGGALSAVTWPAVFWAGEIVLAGLVGGWSFSMVTRQPQTDEATARVDEQATGS